MSKLPRLSGKKLISLLENVGFNIVRIKGSHYFLKNKEGKSTVVPVHANEDLGPGITSKILKDCEITKEELLTLLRK